MVDPKWNVEYMNVDFYRTEKKLWLVDFYISNAALNLENSWRLLESI